MKRIILLSMLMIGMLGTLFSQDFLCGNDLLPVNNVLGDVSYFEKFGTCPNQETDDQVRIETHLEYVAKQLAKAPTNHLSEMQQTCRSEAIDLLSAYAKKGLFPLNNYRQHRTSVFVDEAGTNCAVGSLIANTFGQEAANKINEKYQLASIFEMDLDLLEDWMGIYGLSLEECAMIQPTYGPIINPRRPPPPPRMNATIFDLTLRSMSIDAEINDQAAETQITQVFYNHTIHAWQGQYLLPLPKNVTIDKFTMTVDGKEMQGELLSAQKANQIYENIVRNFQDPAILQYHDQALLRLKIFPIPPGKERKIIIKYTELLDKEDGTISYTVPLKTAQKQGQIDDFSLRVNVRSANKLKNVKSLTHEVEAKKKDDRHYLVGYEGKAFSSYYDFQLDFSVSEKELNVHPAFYTAAGEDDYFFLDLNAGETTAGEIMEKDVVFVVDASGSMSGKKMMQTKKALTFCIDNLNAKDRFNIVRFSTEAEQLFSGLQKPEADIKEAAFEYVEALKPIGGTNIEEALQMALEDKEGSSRPFFVIFLTDGKPTIGETRTDPLIEKVNKLNSDQTRIFTFGIGTELNTHLLDKITEATNSYRTYVLPTEDIEVKVSNFFRKVSSPVLTDVEIEYPSFVRINQVYPKQCPDLFLGSTRTLLGRYSGNGTGTIRVKGKVNGQTKQYEFPVTFEKKSKEKEYIAAIWATRAVGFLLDQIRLHGADKELIDEVTRLAKRHGIITPYTSYLILEDEAQLNLNGLGSVNNQILEDAQITTADKAQAKRNFESMNESVGEESINASRDIQELNDVVVAAPRKKGYKNSSEAPKQIIPQNAIRQFKGKAFYFSGGFWVDPDIQHLKDEVYINKKVKYNSAQYYKLMADHNDLVPYLSLGKNLRILWEGNTIIEIYE